MTRLETVCPPVGLFDKIEASTHTVSYEGEGHIALYTDGLMEVMEGTQEEQIQFLEQTLSGSHTLDKDQMQRLFFDEGHSQEREDDKCLVWIRLKEKEIGE
ncbi:Stage II sporulation protein E (SpoIIE) [compost metagenome]